MRTNECVRVAREKALKLFICRESVHETINKYDDIVIDMVVAVRLCMRYTYFPGFAYFGNYNHFRFGNARAQLRSFFVLFG